MVDQPQSPADQKIVDEVLNDFSQMARERCNFESLWTEIAELIDPPSRYTFAFGNNGPQGLKKTEMQFDSRGALALERFSAIMDSLCTPRNSIWHGLEASDPELKKQRRVKLYFEEVTRRLFAMRYAPTANFSSQNQMVFRGLGAYGTAVPFIDEYMGHGGVRGVRYKTLALGEAYLRENHQGVVDTLHRYFRMTARQAYQQFGDTLPDGIKGKVDKQGETWCWFHHCVKPRADYEPDRLDVRGKRWGSYYVSVEGQRLVRQGGYNTFPAPATRYTQAPNETYGRSVAMTVLAALKNINTEKKLMLKTGHKALDPVLLTNDDGLQNTSLRPGAIVPGAIGPKGERLLVPLESGNLMIGKELMDDEGLIINDAFLVTLFQILRDSPVMTATQVVEMMNEKGILLAPTAGRQQSDYVGPMIERELDLAAELRLLPPMPPELAEAKGEYSVVHTSPLAKAAKAQETAGFMRTVETALNVVNVTQNPEPLDHFDWDTALPAIADNNSAPTAWMNSIDKIMAIRQKRAAQQQQQTQIQAMPGQAAIMKAEAAVAKSGGKK